MLQQNSEPLARPKNRQEILRIGKWFLGLAALLVVTGCGSWHVVDAPLGSYVEATSPSQLRLTLVDSSQVRVRRPTMSPDSIRGTTLEGRVALQDVAYFEVFQGDPAGTFGVVVAIPLVLYLTARNSAAAPSNAPASEASRPSAYTPSAAIPC